MQAMLFIHCLDSYNTSNLTHNFQKLLLSCDIQHGTNHILFAAHDFNQTIKKQLSCNEQNNTITNIINTEI